MGLINANVIGDNQIVALPSLFFLSRCQFGGDLFDYGFDNRQSKINVIVRDTTQRHQETNTSRIAARKEGHQSRFEHPINHVFGNFEFSAEWSKSNHAAHAIRPGNAVRILLTNRVEPLGKVLIEFCVLPVGTKVSVLDQPADNAMGGHDRKRAARKCLADQTRLGLELFGVQRRADLADFSDRDQINQFV